MALGSRVRLDKSRNRFTAFDIRDIHKRWLGEIYEWAGEYRQVNVSKGEFPFAAAARVPDLMAEFERNIFGRYTPCNFKDRVTIAQHWRKRIWNWC